MQGGGHTARKVVDTASKVVDTAQNASFAMHRSDFLLFFVQKAL